MLWALESISYTPSESLYCLQLNKGQHPVRHQGLFKFLSWFLPDSSVVLGLFGGCFMRTGLTHRHSLRAWNWRRFTWPTKLGCCMGVGHWVCCMEWGRVKRSELHENVCLTDLKSLPLPMLVVALTNLSVYHISTRLPNCFVKIYTKADSVICMQSYRYR